MRVIYRLPAKTSVGYLESLPAPWNRGQMIVAVLGNDAQGLRWAAAALTMPHLRYKLEGNFLVVQGEQIVAGSRELSPEPQFYTTVANEGDAAQPGEAPPGEAIGAEAGETPLTSEVAAVSNSETMTVVRKPSWIAPLLGLSTTLMVMIIGVVVVSSWRQQRRPD